MKRLKENMCQIAFGRIYFINSCQDVNMNKNNLHIWKSNL